MRFGLRLPSFALGARTTSLAAMGSYLARAEALGFEAAVTVDRLLTPAPLYRAAWLSPMILLAGLAGVTQRMRLGTQVLVLPLRNPVYFAKEWATLDVLCGGRSILGLGAGWSEQEFTLMGVPHRERGPRLDECLAILEALWGGDHVTHHGRFYRLDDVSIEPKPLQQPRPPLWLGGGSQPNAALVSKLDTVLGRIARHADAWVPPASATPELVRRDWERIVELSARARRARPPGRVYSNFVHVLQPGEPATAAAEWFQAFSGMDHDYWRTYYLLGEAEEVADRIASRLDASGGAEWVVLNPLSFDVDQLEQVAVVCDHLARAHPSPRGGSPP
jgi:probable F420-dependent oxidoreductase